MRVGACVCVCVWWVCVCVCGVCVCVGVGVCVCVCESVRAGVSVGVDARVLVHVGVDRGVGVGINVGVDVCLCLYECVSVTVCVFFFTAPFSPWLGKPKWRPKPFWFKSLVHTLPSPHFGVHRDANFARWFCGILQMAAFPLGFCTATQKGYLKKRNMPPTQVA